jgi:hypothetical protein
MLHICIDLIPVLLLSGWVLYEKQMATIALSPLGKLIAILLIVYYSKINVFYGGFVCVIIIIYYYTEYRKTTQIKPITDSIYSESFSTMNDFKENNCKNGILLNKGHPVNPEMVQHVYPYIHYKTQQCNPCSDTCEFSIIEEQLKADENLKPKTSDDFSLNNVLEKMSDFVPALWVKSEHFSLLHNSK